MQEHFRELTDETTVYLSGTVGGPPTRPAGAASHHSWTDVGCVWPLFDFLLLERTAPGSRPILPNAFADGEQAAKVCRAVVGVNIAKTLAEVDLSDNADSCDWARAFRRIF